MKSDNDGGKLAAILSYIPFLCFIPLVSRKKTSFVSRHAKQGFLLLIVQVTALVFLIDQFSHLFWVLILLLSICCALYGMFKALSGKEWKIPFIGNVFEKYEI